MKISATSIVVALLHIVFAPPSQSVSAEPTSIDDQRSSYQTLDSTCWQNSDKFFRFDCGPEIAYYFVDSKLITYRNIGCTSAFHALWNYSIKNDSIYMEEVESYEISTNVGYVSSHYKHRKSKRVLPLCLFKDDDDTTSTEDASCKFYKLTRIDCAGRSWHKIEASNLYRRTKHMIIHKDY